MKQALVAIFLLATSLAAHAQDAKTPEQRVHQAERLRIFYHVEGQHAVDLMDANANGIPDQVEDAMIQTQAAQALFVEVLGFPDPFQAERFRSARFLDIHFRHKDLLKTNGVTYDELQRFNPQRRFIAPEEVAQTVLWLCTPAAHAITGQAISVSGGEV